MMFTVVRFRPLALCLTIAFMGGCSGPRGTGDADMKFLFSSKDAWAESSQDLSGGLVEHSFALGGATFYIMLPPEFDLAESKQFARDLAPDDTAVVYYRVGYRVARYLRFSTRTIKFHGQPQAQALNGGGTLTYEVIDNLGGGSGGDEAELFGLLSFGDALIAVKATDQGEFVRDPRWCIEYLHSLRRN